MADHPFTPTRTWLADYLLDQCGGIVLAELDHAAPFCGQETFDSLDLAELVMNAEDEFAINLDGIENDATPAHLIAVIDRLRGLNRPDPMSDPGVGEAVLCVALLGMCALGGAIGLALNAAPKGVLPW